MAESRHRWNSTEKNRKAVEESILDYACKNYMDDVITAMASHRGRTMFTDLNVPHLRVIAVTIYSIVKREDIVNMDNALRLMGIIHRAVPDVVTDEQYVKLTTGLKTKVLLNKLSQQKFDYADVCSTLNKYFPRSELKTSGVSQQDFQLNSYQLRYRCLISRLMVSVSEREAYLRNKMDAELGPTFMAAIQCLLRLYVDRVNMRLSTPVIQQIVAEGPQSQISHDFQESQSNCMDQLLAASFRGPPSPDVLLSILNASWEEEGTETMAEEKMDISDDMEEGSVQQDRVTHLPSSDPAGKVTDGACSVELVSASLEKGATLPKLVQQQRLEVLGHQQTSASAPAQAPCEHQSLPETSPTQDVTSTNQILPDSPVSQQADSEQCTKSQQNHLKCQESDAGGQQVSSALPESPQRIPTVGTFQKGSTLRAASSSAAVSKSRIYLSRSRPQSRSQLKRKRFVAEEKGSCIGSTQSESYDPKISDLVKSYKTCVKINAVSIEDSSPETQQVSSSSDCSQSLSDNSCTSVSLLSGLMGFELGAKRLRSWSPVMTVLGEGDEMMGLTLSYPFEDTVISEIEVYPVSRLRPCCREDGSIGPTDSNSNELETIQETPTNAQAVCHTASRMPEQENTISSSNKSPSLGGSSGSQSQTAEVRVEEEVRGHELTPEMEGNGSCSADSKHTEPDIVKSDQSSMSRPQDVEEAPPLKKSEMPVIKLKRLSQDSKVRIYLESSTSSRGGTSVDETSQSSDSEDSIVPDSEDESGWTSDSSSLPCIELRPDSECPLIRRIPSLTQYLNESREEGTTENCRMRQCTVQLRRLKPGEIDALTKGQSILKLCHSSSTEAALN